MLKYWLFNKMQALRHRLGLRTFNPAGQFGHSDPTGKSELSHVFASHVGRLAHKWDHYLDIYDKHLADRRGKPFRMLEIGVFHGGSLELWRRYFGDEAILFGIDIDPECADRVDPPNQVRIGSQDDPIFLRKTVTEMGGLDVVLDDGSHVGRHQWASFRTLWPLLPVGGLYIIEDTHSSYWPSHEGGYGRRNSGIGLAKQLIDDQHGWYHDKGHVLASPNEFGAIHVYDSMVFIEKANRPPPVETLRPYAAVAEHFGG